MELLGLRQDVPQVPRQPVGQILTYKGHPKIALVDLGTDASELLRASWPKTARPFDSGGIIESSWLLPMLGAGNTTAAALQAGNVFLATANPATLMTIGTGVGTAVMGPAGIVAHAPFVAASSALIPVVAPVMLFTTLSSMTICARLDRAQRTLGRLYEAVEVVRRLMDADDYARFESAAEQIDEIRSEFEHRQRFADDVRIKLSLVKRDVKHLRQKYGRLVTRHIDSEDDARSTVSDLNRFFLASLYDLQVDLLRLYLALQDDPDFVELRQSRLREKIERYGKDFRQILDDDRVAAYHRKVKEDLARSEWQWLPDGWRLPFGSELVPRTRRVRAVRNDFNSIRARIQGWIDAFESAEDEREQAIVFYRELDGARAVRGYHTRDLRLQQAVA